MPVEDRRALERLDPAYRKTFAVQPGTATTLCPGQFVEHRPVGHTEHDLAPVHQGNLRREKRVLANETLGAVDRIDEPQIVAVGSGRASLLAIEAMLGTSRVDDGPYGLLAFQIRLGHRRAVGLRFDFEIAAVVAAADLGSRASRFERRVQKSGIMIVILHARSSVADLSASVLSLLVVGQDKRQGRT